MVETQCHHISTDCYRIWIPGFLLGLVFIFWGGSPMAISSPLAYADP